MVVADAAHHKILAFGGGLRRRRGPSAELVGPLLRLGRGAVVHRHLMATLFHEVSCHRETHHAETEKSDFSHVCNLVSDLVCDLGVLPAALTWPGGIFAWREAAP